jgi:hypothetical protein
MSFTKLQNQAKVLVSSRGEGHVQLCHEGCILYGFVFSSTVKCKVELKESSIHSSNILLSAFNTTHNNTINVNFPIPIHLETGCFFRIENIDQFSADCYVTAFYADPYKVYSEEFTKELEETLSR